ncbi:PH domain-containing protein [Pseudodesulfovibrio sp.]|uniref:PH domain-containing protein n=1 Tax=unclassified Pseudodesulfovibrio TaxID=2661612 RepID=UPI003B00524F
MANTYKIPMKPIIPALLLVFVVGITAVVAWCFRSGLTWSGISLAAIAWPLSLLYWYMLYVNPKRASITVADEGILLAAPPFASAVIPWASVEDVFPGNLKTDEKLTVARSRKTMQFAGYNSGLVDLTSGDEAVIVANRTDVLCIKTAERYYLLGPSDLEGFTADVEATRPQ